MHVKRAFLQPVNQSKLKFGHILPVFLKLTIPVRGPFPYKINRYWQNGYLYMGKPTWAPLSIRLAYGSTDRTVGILPSRLHFRHRLRYHRRYSGTRWYKKHHTSHG